MKKIRLWIISFSFIFLLFTTKTSVFAATSGDVLINEFSPKSDPEWVELYNPKDVQISIAGWKLKDAANHFEDLASACILPKGFYTYQRPKGWLNDSGGDTVYLLDDQGSIIDSVSYGTSGATVASTPPSDKSASRVPDGGSDWQISDPTKTDNSIPCITPTLPPSPTPTSVPTPIKTPTPTKTPTSAPIKSGPTATPTSKPTIISSFSPMQKLAGESGEALFVESLTSSSTPTTINKPSSNPSPTSSNKVLGASQNNLSKILIGLGIILLAACGILASYHYKKSKKDGSLF